MMKKKETISEGYIIFCQLLTGTLALISYADEYADSPLKAICGALAVAFFIGSFITPFILIPFRHLWLEYPEMSKTKFIESIGLAFIFSIIICILLALFLFYVGFDVYY